MIDAAPEVQAVLICIKQQAGRKQQFV